MRLIIEARLSDRESGTVEDGVLAIFERRDCSLAQLGLTLAEGRYHNRYFATLVEVFEAVEAVEAVSDTGSGQPRSCENYAALFKT